MNTVTPSLLGPSSSMSVIEPAALTKFLATVLLAAGASACMVATDRLLGSWAQSHLVAAWLALWAVAVMAIVLLRGFTRLLAQKLMTGLDAWSAQVARGRADARLWAMAQKDPRMMRDLEMALDRASAERNKRHDSENGKARRAARLVRDRLYYI